MCSIRCLFGVGLRIFQQNDRERECIPCSRHHSHSRKGSPLGSTEPFWRTSGWKSAMVWSMAWTASQVHQMILTELLVPLRNHIIREKNGNCSVFPAQFDVRLSDTPFTIVQPGLIIVCDKKMYGKRCNGAPDFIIEIVSLGNPSDDYIRKLYYYKNHGVCKYRIVDPRRKIVTINYLEGDIVDASVGDLFINFSESAYLLDI